MNRKSMTPQVLRETVLHAQPHRLERALQAMQPLATRQLCANSRPESSLEATPMAASDGTLTPTPNTSPLRQASPEAVYEDASRKGYDEGFAAGKNAGFEEGRRAGYQAGQQAGSAAAHAGYTTRMERMDTLLKVLPEQIEQRILSVEDDLVDIIYTAVCRIVGEAAVSSDSLRIQVRNTAMQIGARPVAAVKLHPQDYLALQGDDGIVDLMSQHGARIQWLPDDRISLGGCIIDSPEGSLDARLETQLERLRDTLLATRRMRIAAKGAS